MTLDELVDHRIAAEWLAEQQQGKGGGGRGRKARKGR